jgi:hypothetical protein
MNRYTGNTVTSDILQYRITSDTKEKVSSQSEPTHGGLALKGKDSKYIYYFKGVDTGISIHRFNTETKTTVKLSTVLPSVVYDAAGVVSSQSAFIFDGHRQNILEFDLDTETVKIVGDLSFRNDTVYFTASITDSASNTAWLFPGYSSKLINRVKIFSSATHLKPISERKRSSFIWNSSDSVGWLIWIHNRGNWKERRIRWNQTSLPWHSQVIPLWKLTLQIIKCSSRADLQSRGNIILKIEYYLKYKNVFFLCEDGKG